MRAVAYHLYGPTVPTDSPESRSQQERDFAGYCDRNRHTLKAVFADPSGNELRGSFNDLLRYLRENSASYLVLVHRPVDLGITLEEAVDSVLSIDLLGCQVVCTDEETPDPVQGLLRAFLGRGGGGARRQRIREAMEAKALLGEGLGRPPYGYRIGRVRKLEEVTQEAEVVRLMFALYREQGLGLRSIAAHLNQRGRRTRLGGSWSTGTIRDILRNQVYMGTYTRFGLRIPGNHAALVSSQEFRQVRDRMEVRSPRRQRTQRQPFLLSGLAYCGTCGNRMIGVTRRQSWRRRDGGRMQGVYRYYQCQSRANQGVCDYHTWRAVDLEELVVEKLRQGLSESTRGNEERRGQEPSVSGTAGRKMRDGLTSWPVNLNRRYLRHLREAADGSIPLSRLRSLLDGIAEERRVLEGDADPAHSSTPGIWAWEGLDWAARRKLLTTLVERVVTHDREAAITLRSSSS